MNDTSDDKPDLLQQVKKIQNILYTSLKTEKLEQILEKVLSANCELMDAESGSIVLWESELGFFNTIHNIDPSIPLKGMILIPSKGGLDGRLYRERDRDFIELSNYSKNMDAFPQLKPVGFTYAIGVPLFVNEDELIGTMCFYYKNRSEKVNSYEKTLLEELAQQTSVAIINARLYQDLEESKKNQEHARSFLDLLLNSSPDIIVNTDLTGKIKFWNKAAEETTDFKASEMMNHKLPLVMGENEEKFYNLFSEVRKGNASFDHNFYFYSKDTKNKKEPTNVILVNLYLVPVKNHRDSIDSILITGKNISEKHELKQKVDEFDEKLTEKDHALTQKEQLLDQTQQELIMAEKLATIGTLSDKLNHQINNPLMGILTSLSIILEDLKEISQDKNKEIDSRSVCTNFINPIGDILEEGRRIKNVLKELRYFSEVAKESHFRENTDLLDILNQTIDQIKSTKDFENIKIKLSKEVNRAKIFGNFRQIKYVLMQILDNAFISIQNRKDQSSKGIVSIILKKIKLNQKDHFRLVISDNGIGMSKNQLNQLFEPFYTGWSQTTDIDSYSPAEHIGLSLATTKTILQNHKAHIIVRSISSEEVNNMSSDDTGSTFIIDFPEL